MHSEEHAYGFAIVRIDDFFDDPLTASNVEERITITKVVATSEQAETEVARLNTLQAGQGPGGVRYYAQQTRLRLSDGDADTA